MKKKIIGAIIAGVVAITTFSSVTIINSGNTGVRVDFGRVSNTVLNEGVNFKIPFVSKIVQMNNKIQNVEMSAEGATQDKQSVNYTISINFRLSPEKSAYVYKNVGKNYVETVLTPAIADAVKSNVSSYNAETLLTDRESLASDIQNSLNTYMEEYGIKITKVNVNDIQFSEKYTDAIEEKQILEEGIKKAELEKQKSEVEAETARIKAQGEADANKIKSDSITDQILQQQMIEKWDGKLPVVSGENGMMIDFDNLTRNTTQSKQEN